MIRTATRLNTVEEYYFSKKLREVRSLITSGKPIINIGIGSPDLKPPNEVVNALQKSLNDTTAHQYQSYQGLPELRVAMTSFYESKFDVSLNSLTEVLPLMGSKEGIMHISMAFLNEGDKVLIPNPGYPTYTSVTKLVGAIPEFYDLKEKNGWFPDLTLLEEKDLSQVKIMWLNYPHMPTGVNGTVQMFKELVAFAKKHQILLVNDNPYSFILNDNPVSILSVEGSKDIAIELNSLSKTFNMAGWRVGMIVGNEYCINAILKMKSNMDSGMFYGIQIGAIAALKSTSDWFFTMNEVYKKRRDLIFTWADKLKCTYDRNTVGMVVWAKLPNGVDTTSFIDEILYKKNVFITPGTVFGTNGEGYIRFSLCIEEEKIKEAIQRF